MFDISLRIKSIIIAIYLFVAGIVYGDAPVKMDFECTVPSGVYEYEAGDTVELEITFENLGRPFEYNNTYGEPDKVISVSYNSNIIYDNRPDSDVSLDGYKVILIKHNYKEKKTVSFVIPEDAVKGKYTVMVGQAGESEYFTDLITVK